MNLHSIVGREAGGEKRSRDGDGETTNTRKRKRVSRWSDGPPIPQQDADNKDNNNKEDGDQRRDVPVQRPLSDVPVVGDIYSGKISSLMQFGCFVQLEGLRSASSSTIFNSNVFDDNFPPECV